MILKISEFKKEFKYWDAIGAMIDQSIDIALNLSQSGHPGGSRSKMPVLVSTLLSGVMRWDIRNPGKTFGDRFVLLAPTILEKRERLEQLRALEAGMRIDIALVDTVPLGVDTPYDLERAQTML